MDERELVQRAIQFKIILVRDLPGYREWSRKYQDEDSALIEYLDSVEISVATEGLTGPHEKLFEELLSDLREEFKGDEG